MERKKIRQIGDYIIKKSTKVKKGDKVFIEVREIEAISFANYLMKKAYENGAENVFIWLNTDDYRNNLLANVPIEKINYPTKQLMKIARDANVHIRLKGAGLYDYDNIDKVIKFEKLLFPILRQYSNTPRRCLFYYPSMKLARKARMSKRDLEDLVYRFCMQDWEKVRKKQDKLVKLMEKTKKIRIKTPDSDIKFSIQGMPVVNSHGARNMPDGEVFAAPRLKSVEGNIVFDYPFVKNGVTYKNINLFFKKGKIYKIKGTRKQKKALQKMLGLNKGNAYIGEFAIGTSHIINRITRITIFDEKTFGTIHFALGRCSIHSKNGNLGANIHWDMIKDLRKNGEIYFDNQLIFHDGKFVNLELEELNS